MDLVAYTMQYEGPTIKSALALVPFEAEYYEKYRDVYHDCFYEMRKALELRPYCACDSLEQLLAKKESIFLWVADNEIVGSVAVYENEIDDLIVAKKFQNQGYGKQLLQFAIALLQERERFPIRLRVAEWNRKAVSLYEHNGFRISEIIRS
jgi:ribosomal protein S18 acetylase RimI-like enzyme